MNPALAQDIATLRKRFPDWTIVFYPVSSPSLGKPGLLVIREQPSVDYQTRWDWIVEIPIDTYAYYLRVLEGIDRQYREAQVEFGLAPNIDALDPVPDPLAEALIAARSQEMTS